MNYTEAQYCLEKIASTAWKRNFHLLSKGAKDKLRNSSLNNFERNANGLRKGTKALDNTLNIIERKSLLGNRGKAVKAIKNTLNDPNGFAAASREEVAELVDKPFAKKTIKGLTRFSQKLQASYPARHLSGGYTTVLSEIKGNPSVVNISKSPKALFKNPAAQKIYGKQEMEKVLSDLKKNPLSENYLGEVFGRHERDEVRHGLSNLKRTKGDAVEARNHAVFSHLDPNVLARESANVALAPKEVRDAMTMLRRRTGEAAFIKKLTGRPYGSSPVYKPIKIPKNKSMSEYLMSLDD